MEPIANAILSLGFLATGGGATFLMYHLWRFPYDHETHTSEAPRTLVRVHRLLGYIYAAIYIYFMYQMLPRLWNYQVEFPARTVAHFMLGISVGALLVIKVAIVRFFKHLEATLIPLLGTFLLICTVLLVSLSATFPLRELYLSRQLGWGEVYGEENLERIRSLLPYGQLPSEAPLDELGSVKGLKLGRKLVMTKCVTCHDLRTVIAKTRTPRNWVQTVSRMADRSTISDPIAEEEEWYMAAYLIAITPEIQKSLEDKRKDDLAREETLQAAKSMIEEHAQGGVREAIDSAEARVVFERICTFCHTHQHVEEDPPETELEVYALLNRMITRGMRADAAELRMIASYLDEVYVN